MSGDHTPARDIDRLALRPKEAAEALGVSERTFRSILPTLPHVRIGGRVVVPVDGLRRWLEDEERSQRGRADRTTDEILAAIGSSRR
jgi:excisionase family DNA binding protein